MKVPLIEESRMGGWMEKRKKDKIFGYNVHWLIFHLEKSFKDGSRIRVSPVRDLAWVIVLHLMRRANGRILVGIGFGISFFIS